MSSPLLTKATLVNLYKKENDPKVKERLLLIIKVREDGQVPFHVVKEIHRSNPWASNWLKRYDKEGIKGLQDRTKSGRPAELSEEVIYQIKKELKESNQGWTTKQVEELIVKKSGGIKYHSLTYTASFENGDSNKKYQERCMLILHPKKKKRISKKGHQDTCCG
jgi:transposase